MSEIYTDIHFVSHEKMIDGSRLSLRNISNSSFLEGYKKGFFEDGINKFKSELEELKSELEKLPTKTRVNYNG